MQGAGRAGPGRAPIPGVTDALEREERDALLARGRPPLTELRRLALGCRACGLWARATQTVFGEGSPRARLLIVGEQPGNSEDLEGVPFVGPAGRLLDRALVGAGVDRESVYVTNVVKHFKWKRARTGKRRIHDTPNRGEVTACRPWLEAQVDRIQPKLIVALGATASHALLGRGFRITRQRGEVLDSDLGPALATIHPSAVLRAPDEERDAAYRGLVEDLAAAARRLGI